MVRDPELAKIMREAKVKAPIEKIVQDDWWITIHNFEKFQLGERAVILACGHTAITKARTKAPCTICHEMILNGEDYDAFRNLHTPSPQPDPEAR